MRVAADAGAALGVVLPQAGTVGAANASPTADATRDRTFARVMTKLLKGKAPTTRSPARPGRSGGLHPRADACPKTPCLRAFALRLSTPGVSTVKGRAWIGAETRERRRRGLAGQPRPCAGANPSAERRRLASLLERRFPARQRQVASDPGEGWRSCRARCCDGTPGPAGSSDPLRRRRTPNAGGSATTDAVRRQGARPRLVDE